MLGHCGPADDHACKDAHLPWAEGVPVHGAPTQAVKLHHDGHSQPGLGKGWRGAHGEEAGLDVLQKVHARGVHIEHECMPVQNAQGRGVEGGRWP